MRTRAGALALVLLVVGCSAGGERPSEPSEAPLATAGPVPPQAADARVERLLETVLPTRKDLRLDALGPGDEDRPVSEPVLERLDVPPPTRATPCSRDRCARRGPGRRPGRGGSWCRRRPGSSPS